MFMLERKSRLASLAACFVLSLATTACALPGAQDRSQFGAQVDGRSYDREIVVAANVRWIGVTAGQVVRFVVPDAAGPSNAFTWYFDTWGGRVADLSRLAPEGMVRRPINVYIADDPRYGGQ
jgi:hypothetical protein